MPFLPCFSPPRPRTREGRKGLGTSRTFHFRFPNGAPGLNPTELYENSANEISYNTNELQFLVHVLHVLINVI